MGSRFVYQSKIIQLSQILSLKHNFDSFIEYTFLFQRIEFMHFCCTENDSNNEKKNYPLQIFVGTHQIVHVEKRLFNLTISYLIFQFTTTTGNAI